MITCVKTGCVVYLAEYGTWLYGDAFEGNDFYIFRVGQESSTPERGRKHFEITQIGHWFDRDMSGRYGTLIAYAHDVKNFGYEGEPL